jgi:hypothetical protein
MGGDKPKAHFQTSCLTNHLNYERGTAKVTNEPPVAGGFPFILTAKAPGWISRSYGSD